MTKPCPTKACRYCGAVFLKSFTKQIICSIECAFWARVQKAEVGCWLWMGSTHVHGYGEFGFGGTIHRAHRFSYELHHGPIPAGIHVAHRCDIPLCVNPAHLFLATHAENMADMAQKLRAGRAKLTVERVREIKALIATGMKGHQIAKAMSVNQGTVWFISTGKQWGHVK